MSFSAAEIRRAAANQIDNLIQQQGDVVRWSAIAAGFSLSGQKIYFANKARGIFKPAQLNDGAALSIRSARPSRAGRSAPYNDEIIEDGILRYRLQRNDPNNTDNRYLQQALHHQLPLIYFCGLADSVYQIFFPVIINHIDTDRMEALMTWKTRAEPTNPKLSVINDPHVSLGKRTAINQLYNARFRARVLSAYDFRCALSGMPIGSLLRATTLLHESAAQGIPAINNAICMSVLHQAAFEANLIGVNPEGKVKVGRLLNHPHNAFINEQLLSSLGRGDRAITMPKLRKLWPDRDCLNTRFKLFEEAQK